MVLRAHGVYISLGVVNSGARVSWVRSRPVDPSTLFEVVPAGGVVRGQRAQRTGVWADVSLAVVCRRRCSQEAKLEKDVADSGLKAGRIRRR